jgi:signal transduction histidine kinase
MSLTVRVIAPVGRDAELIVSLLTESGLNAESCVNAGAILDRFAPLASPTADDPLGPLLVTEEALTPEVVERLADLVDNQPAWSDVPLLILTTGGRSTLRSRMLQQERLSLGVPILLERPIRTETLVSSVRAAVRARMRQYEVRDALDERDRILAELRSDRETLERLLEDRKRAETALVQSEKLAAVGRLAASISHEINNPLEAVTNLLYLIRQEDNLPNKTTTYLSLAERELARVSQIAGQTLRFHRQSTNPTSITPEDLLDSVVALYQGRLINAHIELQFDHRAATAITCYEGDIRQVLNNLVGNAIDSMRHGGRLLIRTHDSICWRTQRRGVRITVADTGYGMSADVRSRIFEAFYTTKGLAGTGLGLWISHGIVAKHHGHLNVRSCNRSDGETGKKTGTVFSLFLPRELQIAA